MRKNWTVLTILICSVALFAQDTPKAEVFGGYSYLRNNGNSFNGWEGQVTGYFNRYFGITGDVSGHYRTSSIFDSTTGLSASVNNHLYNFLAGPTITGRLGNHAIFGHALFGAAHSSVSGGVSIPIIGGVSTGIESATKFAMAFGGGLDIGLSPRFAIRPAQVDYLYTKFGNIQAIGAGLSTTSGHQNSFRYSAGIVIRF